MTLQVALDHFMSLASSVPIPAARLRLPTKAGVPPDEEWNATRKAFDRHLLAWRSGFISHLGKMRAVLELAIEEAGAEAVGKTAVDSLTAFRQTVEEVIALTRSQIEPDQDALNKILSGRTRKRAHRYEKEYREAMRRRLDFLIDANDRLLALELDFDPEARANGPSFDNAADLVAHLRS
jgi:hypothetical protein